MPRGADESRGGILQGARRTGSTHQQRRLGPAGIFLTRTCNREGSTCGLGSGQGRKGETIRHPDRLSSSLTVDSVQLHKRHQCDYRQQRQPLPRSQRRSGFVPCQHRHSSVFPSHQISHHGTLRSRPSSRSPFPTLHSIFKTSSGDRWFLEDDKRAWYGSYLDIWGRST